MGVPDDVAPVLHVRGRVILDDTTEVGELWCVGGRVTF